MISCFHNQLNIFHSNGITKSDDDDDDDKKKDFCAWVCVCEKKTNKHLPFLMLHIYHHIIIISGAKNQSINQSMINKIISHGHFQFILHNFFLFCTSSIKTQVYMHCVLVLDEWMKKKIYFKKAFHLYSYSNHSTDWFS